MVLIGGACWLESWLLLGLVYWGLGGRELTIEWYGQSRQEMDCQGRDDVWQS